MSFVILGLIIVLVLISLGLGRAFGAGSLVDEMENALKGSVSDVKDVLTEWWLKNGVPFIKRLLVSLAVVSMTAFLGSGVLALMGKVSAALPAVIGSIAIANAVWVALEYRKNRGDFSTAAALNGSIVSVAAMGAGIYLYGQMTCDIVTSLVGYLVVVVATEAVCAMVVMAAWLLARANQLLEGSANVGLQFVREILFNGNAALQKIVDINLADEEEFVPNAKKWCSRLRLVRDTAFLLGILLPSPVTLVVGTIAGLVTNVGVRVYMAAGSVEEADKRNKSAAKTYNLVLAVLMPLVVLRFLPFLLDAFPKEWAEQSKGITGVIAALKDTLAHPTAYLAIGAIAAAFFIPKRNEEAKPTSSALVSLTVFASLVLFIAYWVMWGSTVFYIVPLVLAVCWLVARSSLRGAAICLGGGYLLVLLVTSFVRTGNVAKEKESFKDVSQALGAVPVPTIPVAHTPPPSASSAPKPPQQAQAPVPVRHAPVAHNGSSDQSTNDAWAVLCQHDPSMCDH